MNHPPSPTELAEEARRALEAHPMTSEEHFEFLVARGIIDRTGRVLIAKLFGEKDGDLPDTSPPAPSENGTAAQTPRPQTPQDA
jgi:hypothetical protein